MNVRMSAAMVGVALLASSLASAAEPGSPAPAREPRVIRVTGSGEAQARPDLAEAMLGVVTEGSDASAAAKRNDEVTARLLAAIKGRVPERDIRTAAIELHPRYDQRPQPESGAPKIVGYEASTQLVVRVRNLSALGPVLDAAVRAGANRVQGVQLTLSDPAAALAEARRAAVRDARRQAEALASAAGVKLGAILSISDAGAEPSPPIPYGLARAEMAQGGPPVATGELTLRARVSIVFEIGEVEDRSGPRSS